MAVCTIKNDKLVVAAATCGAQLTSIQTVDGIEFLWQPDPAVWNAQAPLLFPIIGKLADFQYKIDDKIYEMGWHGFAHRMDFELLRHAEQELAFGLKDSPETRSIYPFEFELMVSYKVSENKLITGFKVTNTGKAALFFSIGAHPGFNLPAATEECYLEFEQEEIADAFIPGSQQLLSSRTVRLLNNERILPLSPFLFNQGALVLSGLRSRNISLCCRKKSRRVKVDFTGFPYVGLWSKPGAPFVCIEPWYGHADPETPYGSFHNKPGVILLEAEGIFTCAYTISIEE